MEVLHNVLWIIQLSCLMAFTFPLLCIVHIIMFLFFHFLFNIILSQIFTYYNVGFYISVRIKWKWGRKGQHFQTCKQLKPFCQQISRSIFPHISLCHWLEWIWYGFMVMQEHMWLVWKQTFICYTLSNSFSPINLNCYLGLPFQINEKP